MKLRGVCGLPWPRIHDALSEVEVHRSHVTATGGVLRNRQVLRADVLLVLFVGQVHARERDRDLLVELPADRRAEIGVSLGGCGRRTGHVATGEVRATPVVVDAGTER